ncbi:MAG: cytochrome c3 family protein [bacterium]|nr:cytochrome c3 family protein [bacterium]MDT8366496.1 cytochrome c3 family protein [bacterium]
MKRVSVVIVLVGVMLMFALPAMAADYVGSNACFECHQDNFNDWQASGHPYKLRTMEKARYAKLPLPPGWAWEDISYVIGGANWKARYIDKKGFIVTSAKDGTEARTQYNLEDGSWSFYHKGEKKPYDCGPCHMTAYKKEGNQDGLEGMIGTWAEDGIGCEECHGPGSAHVASPAKSNVRIDKTAEACGKCHQRGGMGPKPPARGGFIRHHEQINELKAGVHKDLTCLDCHDPHKRADQVAKNNCLECHDDVGESFAKTLHGRTQLECIDCHMPKASKSAITSASYTGDIRTHIFKINTAADANMFQEVEEKGKKSTFAKGFVTLDFTCLSCHQSRDRKWASEMAKDVHKK